MSEAKKTTFRIREAIASTDAEEILKIYKPFVTDSTTSFEYETPTKEEMERRITSTLPNFPWLVSEVIDKDGSSIAGYAYASKYASRAGYQWIAEPAIYISPQYRGHGVGTKLYVKLCEILKKQGYIHLFARIAGNNSGSVEFHKKLGFEYVGEWENCGNKFGKWCKVSWYSKLLNELVENPEKPRSYFEIKGSLSWDS